MKYYSATWESIKQHQTPDWFRDAKLGIFIHWGIYSVPAWAPKTWELGEVAADENWFCNNPYAEWYFNSINVKRGPTYEYHLKKYGSEKKYEDFIPEFTAIKFKAQEWAELFQNAGAKYVILTTKHHDGFCLFDTQYSDFNSVKQGPKRDLMGELSKAVRKVGLKMGAYYSGAIDWRYSPAPIFNEDQHLSNASPTYEYADFAYKQVCELIDKYQPSVLWNDIGWVKQGEHMLPSLFSYYYNQVAEGVTNNRWNNLWHDFICKEYRHGEVSRNQVWEMCRGLGLSFGYNQNESDADYISANKLITLLVEVVANNGNLLINIGPKADGTIPIEQALRLEALGNWLKVNGEAIYGTRPYLESLEQGALQIHFTQKNDSKYALISGLADDEASFTIPLKGEIKALESALKFTTNSSINGTEIKIHNYQKDWQVLVFKTEGE